MCAATSSVAYVLFQKTKTSNLLYISATKTGQGLLLLWKQTVSEGFRLSEKHHGV